MFHLSGMLIVFSFVSGSLVLSFGAIKPIQMLGDALAEPGDGFAGNPCTNALMCECACRSALFGGTVAGLVGLVATVASIGGDVSAVGEHIGRAISAPIFGAALFSLVFRPLKLKFLGLQTQNVLRLDPVPAKKVISDFILMATGVVISIVLLVAYLIKTSAVLEKVLK